MKGKYNLISLLPNEVAYLISLGKNKKLKRTCHHHYYMANDDYDAMKVIAKMRGYDFNIFYNTCVEGMNYR